jgi:hypothetical protein
MVILRNIGNCDTIQNNVQMRLKGQLHEIVDHRFFCHQSTPPRTKAVLHMAQYSPKKSTIIDVQRGHWPRWNRFWRLSKRLARRIRNHMRNGFSPWIRALVWLMKKTEGRKSHATVPLKQSSTSADVQYCSSAVSHNSWRLLTSVNQLIFTFSTISLDVRSAWPNQWQLLGRINRIHVELPPSVFLHLTVKLQFSCCL